MAYEQCTRCHKIDRDSRMQDNICEDCRSVEFSDFVIEALEQTIRGHELRKKIQQEALRLGLLRHKA